MTSNYATKPAKGFSLTEMAIVLAVVGIVLATLWGVVGLVRENIKRDQALDQLVMVVRNVRDYYAGLSAVKTTGGTSSGEYTTLSSYLLERGVLLSEQIRQRNVGSGNFKADHPWGPSGQSTGSFGICSDGANCKVVAPAWTSRFEAQYRGLSNAACAALAAKVVGPSGPPGLLEVYVNGNTKEDPPYTAEQFIDRCTAGASANTLHFVYALRQQN